MSSTQRKHSSSRSEATKTVSSGSLHATNIASKVRQQTYQLPNTSTHRALVSSTQTQPITKPPLLSAARQKRHQERSSYPTSHQSPAVYPSTQSLSLHHSTHAPSLTSHTPKSRQSSTAYYPSSHSSHYPKNVGQRSMSLTGDPHKPFALEYQRSQSLSESSHVYHKPIGMWKTEKETLVTQPSSYQSVSTKTINASTAATVSTSPSFNLRTQPDIATINGRQRSNSYTSGSVANSLAAVNRSPSPNRQPQAHIAATSGMRQRSNSYTSGSVADPPAAVNRQPQADITATSGSPRQHSKSFTSRSSSSPTHSPSPTNLRSSANSGLTGLTRSPLASDNLSDSSTKLSSSLTTLPPIASTTTKIQHLDHTRKILGIQSTHSSHHKPAGLYNTGNSCYLNSVLQCLAHTTKLTDYFLSEEVKNDKPKSKKTPVVEAYISFLQQLWITRDSSIQAVTPARLRTALFSFIPMIRNSDQQDAQEFLQYLLCCLHGELNQPDKSIPSYSSSNLDSSQLAELAWKRNLSFDNSQLSKLFMGQVQSTLTCLKCQNTSLSFETFWSLSLSLPSSSRSGHINVSDCFRLFSAEEKLDNDNKPVCAHCKTLQPCTKRLAVQVFPDILILHLKRFTVRNRFCTKLSSSVKIPASLDVGAIAADKVTPDSFHYELYGVINHSGSMSFGHYLANCKYKQQWYTLNDRNVTPSTDAHVTSPSPSPYVLFYEKTTTASHH